MEKKKQLESGVRNKIRMHRADITLKGLKLLSKNLCDTSEG